MGKRKGRQRDSAFRSLHDADFRQQFYDQRAKLPSELRERVEREGKARGFRNIQKRDS